MRNLLVGAAGSALMLTIDLAVAQWGNDNFPLRIGIATCAFIVFFLASAFIPWKETVNKGKRILSNIRSKGSINIDVREIESRDAKDVVSGINSGKDTTIKIDEIKS